MSTKLDYLFAHACNETALEEKWHRGCGQYMTTAAKIALTVIGSVNIFVYFLILIFLLVVAFRNVSGLGKRRAVVYLGLSNIGFILYFLDWGRNIWLWDYRANSTVINASLAPFYFYGFPLMFCPIMVRSWRVICIYRRTLNWNCTWTKVLERRKRDHKWMLLRIFLLILPFMIAWPLMYWDERVDFVVVPLQAIFMFTNLGFSIVHLTLRKELSRTHMNESISVFVFSVMLILFWVYDNVAFYVFMRTYDQILYSQLGYLLCYNILFATMIAGTVSSLIASQVKKVSGKGASSDKCENSVDGLSSPSGPETRLPTIHKRSYLSGRTPAILPSLLSFQSNVIGGGGGSDNNSDNQSPFLTDYVQPLLPPSSSSESSPTTTVAAEVVVATVADADQNSSNNK